MKEPTTGRYPEALFWEAAYRRMADREDGGTTRRRYQRQTPARPADPTLGDIQRALSALDRRGHGPLDGTAEGKVMRRALAHLAESGATPPPLRRRNRREVADVPGTITMTGARLTFQADRR